MVFKKNYVKLNADNCSLFISGSKAEQVWSQIGKRKMWETKTVKLIATIRHNHE